jgi:uncharacterized protein YdeI (YjbR/CyaY-like superfamily)
VSESAKPLPADLPVIAFEDAGAWRAWLEANHASAPGIWLKFAKKASGKASVSYPEAVEEALCYGWIDGQARGLNESWSLQRFTPRRARSVWSKLNRERALALIESGRMEPAGLAEVERAQRDGRWDAAYDPPSKAEVPDDLTAALSENPAAQAAFAGLDSGNCYAILFRLQNAKRADTRARRIAQFVDMLAKGEKLYP